MPGLLHILYVDLVSFAQQNPGKITTNNIIAVQLRDIPACSIKVLFIFFFLNLTPLPLTSLGLSSYRY